MYQKKEKNILQKMSPHLSQLNVAMAHTCRNYFRRNTLQILKLATYIRRLKITILGANWQLFRLEGIAKCSYFILSTQNIKFHWIVMKIKKFLLPIWWYNRDLFPLRNNVVFILNRFNNLKCLKRCVLFNVLKFWKWGFEKSKTVWNQINS